MSGIENSDSVNSVCGTSDASSDVGVIMETVDISQPVTVERMAADASALGRALAVERGDVRALNKRGDVFVYRSVNGDTVGAFLIDSVAVVAAHAPDNESPAICDVVTVGLRNSQPSMHYGIAMAHLLEYRGPVGSSSLSDYVGETDRPMGFFDDLYELIPGRLWTKCTRIQSAMATLSAADSGLYHVNLQIYGTDRTTPLTVGLDRVTLDQVLTLLTQVG